MTALHRSNGDCFTYQTVKANELEKSKENDFELKKVSLIKEGTKKFIRLDFKPFLEGLSGLILYLKWC